MKPISGRPNVALRFDVGPMSVTISARHINHIEPMPNRYLNLYRPDVGFQNGPRSGRPHFATSIGVGPMSVTISARHRNDIETTNNRYRAAQILQYVLM